MSGLVNIVKTAITSDGDTTSVNSDSPEKTSEINDSAAIATVLPNKSKKPQKKTKKLKSLYTKSGGLKPIEKGVLVEIMHGMHQLLETVKIPYSLICGHNLGALRHHHLVPWTGDGEICSDVEYFPYILMITLMQTSSLLRNYSGTNSNNPVPLLDNTLGSTKRRIPEQRRIFEESVKIHFGINADSCESGFHSPNIVYPHWKFATSYKTLKCAVGGTGGTREPSTANKHYSTKTIPWFSTSHSTVLPMLFEIFVRRKHQLVFFSGKAWSLKYSIPQKGVSESIPNFYHLYPYMDLNACYFGEETSGMFGVQSFLYGWKYPDTWFYPRRLLFQGGWPVLNHCH